MNQFEISSQETPTEAHGAEVSKEWSKEEYEERLRDLDSDYDAAIGESLYAFSVGDDPMISQGLNKKHDAAIQKKQAQLERLKNDGSYLKLLKERIPTFSLEMAEGDASEQIEWLEYKKEAATKYPEFQALVELSSAGEELVADAKVMASKLVNKARVMAAAQKEWRDPAKGRDYRATDFVAAEGFALKAAESGNMELAMQMLQTLKQIEPEKLSPKSRAILKEEEA